MLYERISSAHMHMKKMESDRAVVTQIFSIGSQISFSLIPSHMKYKFYQKNMMNSK